MKKLMLIFYMIFMSLMLLQGCATKSTSARDNSSELYQPSNNTNAQQQYMQQQRVIHNF